MGKIEFTAQNWFLGELSDEQWDNAVAEGLVDQQEVQKVERERITKSQTVMGFTWSDALSSPGSVTRRSTTGERRKGRNIKKY